jgi:hypothetical protein
VFTPPDACTLPTAEQPLRLAEFNDLFAGAVRRVTRVSAEHLQLQLAGPAGLEAAVQDLVDRESRCCSFFSFTVTPGDSLVLDIRVPTRYADVLDSLAAHARAAEV